MTRVLSKNFSGKLSGIFTDKEENRKDDKFIVSTELQSA